MKHLASLFDLTADDVMDILETAERLKEKLSSGDPETPLSNRVATLVFEKPSLRTRLSFEAAMIHLGGSASFFSGQDAGLYGRESLPDIARVISGYSDVVVLRTFSQELIDEFCQWSTCPVINGLSDEYHPCQALTDLFTIRESFGALTDEKLVFVGDGNNVSASLAVLTSMLGLPMTLACPSGYELPDEFMSRLKETCPDSQFTQTNDPIAAVKDADIIYTDVWASMGQEEEEGKRKKDFAAFQVTAELLAQAPDGCRFMHDLPAKRGLEVTDEVMEGPHSIVFQQAENRMHLAKGLLTWIVTKGH
ncbi:MAG: ornithine carbamoyltransferase [Rhodopirellula sp.]|nr:ornithine carbamoyltransferase [Rhodopirellula sp.]